jgi:hypothetical protein
MGTLLSAPRFDLDSRTILNAMALNPNATPSMLRRPRNPASFHSGSPTQEEFRYAEEAFADKLPEPDDESGDRYAQEVLGLAEDMFAGLMRRTFPQGGAALSSFLGNLDALFERENINMSEFRRTFIARPTAAPPVAAAPAPEEPIPGAIRSYNRSDFEAAMASVNAPVPRLTRLQQMEAEMAQFPEFIQRAFREGQRQARRGRGLMRRGRGR